MDTLGKHSLQDQDEFSSPPRQDDPMIVDGKQSSEQNAKLWKPDFNLDPTIKNRTNTICINTQPASISGRSDARLTDFFAPEVFETVLNHPTTAHQFKRFAQSRLCGENLEFLEKIDQYHHSLNEIIRTIFAIYQNFISVNSVSQVNLPEDILVQVNKNLKQLLSNTMPGMESIFLAAQSEIRNLVASDMYPSFVRYQMTIGATKALATGGNEFAGLGDCFVLTNPNIADNPIVYASDGFVSVTGYKRNEIIPRNCRFLQTRQTDQDSVKRIKESLDRPDECVELLLNKRKNGEPFWNLLYTAPLYDSSGKLVYFIGGQIDVSTTINTTSDILRVLSYGINEEETGPQTTASPPETSQRANFLSSLRKLQPVRTCTPGMEPELLNNLKKLPFDEQKRAFYTVYSRYIIVDTNTMLISFYSSGVMDLFCPPRTGLMGQSPRRIVGQDIFKFLKVYSGSRLSKDCKGCINSAVKLGQAVKADIALRTQRPQRVGRFVTYWTPLKNDASIMDYVIVTLSSKHDGKVHQ